MIRADQTGVLPDAARGFGPVLPTLLIFALLLSLAGCKTDSASPEAAAERFFNHVRMRDSDAVWDALSEGSQSKLRDRHQALSATTGDDPTAILSSLKLNALGAQEKPVVVSPLGDQVIVRLSGPRGSTDLHLVRQGPAWKVDLWRSLSLGDQDPQGQ